MLATYWLCFFQIKTMLFKETLQPLPANSFVVWAKPLDFVVSCQYKGTLLSFVAVIRKPDFATSCILSANSPSSFLDSTFGSFLLPDLCPSPSTLPVRQFLKYKSVQGQSRSKQIKGDQKRSRQIKGNHCDGWGCFQPDQGGSRQIKPDQDGSRQIKGDQCDLWVGVVGVGVGRGVFNQIKVDQGR